METMRLKLIGCDVLLRELCLLIADSPHTFDLEFTEKDSHNHSDNLRKIIQDKIDGCADKNYDAILLAYGICGNSTVGLEARDIPLVIPRAHDCCTLFLGSKEVFQEHFQENPSQPFSSPGYMERSDTMLHDGFGSLEDMENDPVYKEYIEKYGEENAKYIYETMYGHKGRYAKLIYIEIPETANPVCAEQCRKKAEDSQLEFVTLKGSIDLLRNLINGNWREEDFLIVKPGHRLKGLYDWKEIIGSEEVVLEN
jgi:hypothetical protein